MRQIALLAVLLSAPLCHGQLSDSRRIANALEDMNTRGTMAETDRINKEAIDRYNARLEQQMLAAGQNVQALQQMLRAQIVANQKLQNSFDIVNNRLRKLEGKRGMSSGVPAPPYADVAQMGAKAYSDKYMELLDAAIKDESAQGWATFINFVMGMKQERPKVYILIEGVDK